MKRLLFLLACTLLMGVFVLIGLAYQAPQGALSEQVRTQPDIQPHPWNGTQYLLVNDRGQSFLFPKSARGKFAVVGFIYTHCPGICRTLTMRLYDVTQMTQGDSSLMFLCVSFDPRRDTAQTLSAYRMAFGANDARWQFLSGTHGMIDSLCETAEVLHKESYSTRLQSGEEQYFINHSDVVLILDPDGNVKKRFDDASTVEPEEYVKAIRALQQEIAHKIIAQK